MKKIQILGTGCAKCNQLADSTQKAATEIGLECEFEKVTEIAKIMAFGVMVTPALVVDGKVLSSGKVLTVDQAKALLQSVK